MPTPMSTDPPDPLQPGFFGLLLRFVLLIEWVIKEPGFRSWLKLLVTVVVLAVVAYVLRGGAWPSI